MIGAGSYLPAIGLAGLSWIGAFILFLWVYAPILLQPRLDGAPSARPGG
jgi:uncharacterized protein involved in response to NO